jgi:hypothetical protein
VFGPISVLAITALAEIDSAAAFARLGAVPRGRVYESMLYPVVSRYAQQYPEPAVSWMDSNPSRSAAAAVIAGVTLGDFDRGYELIGKIANAEALHIPLARAMLRNPDEAGQIALALLARNDQHARPILSSMLDAWVALDSDAAAGWIMRNLEKLDPALVGSFARQIAARDARAASAYIDRVPPNARDVWFVEVAAAYASSDPIEALDWVQRYRSDPQFEAAYATILGSVATAQPERAAAEVTAASTALQTALAPQVAAAWSAQDPVRAAQWALTIPDEAASSSAIVGVVSSWMRQDPPSTAEWAKGLRRGVARDEAFSVLAARSSSTRLNVVELLTEIDSSEKRLRAAIGAFRVLNGTDPARARQLLNDVRDDSILGEWARSTLGEINDHE